RLGDQARGRGLPHPAHTGHQEGMRQPSALDRISERAHHRLLADQLGGWLRPVLASKHSVRLRGRVRGLALLRLWTGSRSDRRRRFGDTAEQRRLAGSFELGRAWLLLFFCFPWRLLAEHIA